jgi:nicotinamide riboside kinase
LPIAPIFPPFAPDFPFVQDGWREGGDFRQRQHEWYLRTLAERQIPYTLLEGDPAARIEKVKTILQAV